MTKVIILVVLSWCAQTLHLDAQQRAPHFNSASSAGVKPIPRRMVYFILFRHVSNFAHRAADVDSANPTQVQNTFQQEIGLTGDENSILTQVADDCLSNVGKQDAAAQQLITQLQTQTSGQENTSGPQALVGMQANRDKLMDACAVDLQTKLGGAFSKVDAYVTQNLAPKISVTTLPVPFAKKTPGSGIAK